MFEEIELKEKVALRVICVITCRRCSSCILGWKVGYPRDTKTGKEGESETRKEENLQGGKAKEC